MAEEAASVLKYNSNKPLQKADTVLCKEKRKHRFTLFIGYGEEAGAVLKKCEQLKCRLGLSTNIIFLKYLVQFFEENNSELLDTDDIVNQSSIHFSNFHTHVEESVNHSTAATASSQHHQEEEQIVADYDTKSVLSEEKTNSEIQSIINFNLEDSGKIVENLQGTTPLLLVNNKRPLKKEDNDGVREIIAEENSDEPPRKSIKKEEMEGHLNEDSLHIATALSSSAVNFKAVKIVYQYMENIKRDLNYIHGFISSAEKLQNFLDEYRQATSTSFTVRSSRSYLKKRALNAVKAIKSNILEQNDLTIGATQVLDSVGVDKKDNSSDTDTIVSDIFEDGISETLTETTVDGNTDLLETTTDDNESSDKLMLNLTMFDKEQDVVVDNIDELMDDSIVTGPLRWEYILGKPPIPFTGVPFFIIGNTQYQCFYASADIRTQRRKAEIEKNKDNPNLKTRVRRSLKRDCKAVMCIKSVVQFPEFSVDANIHEVKTKKGCRKLKAATLDKIRQAVDKGESIGHPAFWVYIPLPDAHTTHNVLTESGKVLDTESIDEIAQILNVAAQYGGQVHLVQNGEENVVEFKINNVSGVELVEHPHPVTDEYLCFNEPVVDS